MGKPWEKYQRSGPWEKYQTQEVAANEPDSFAKDTLDVAGEFAAGGNRTAVGMADFLSPLLKGSPPVVANSLFRAGKEILGGGNPADALARVIEPLPSARDALAPTGIEGGFMDPGLARDAVRAGGETSTVALGLGGVLKTAASKLPALTAGESTGTGVLRTVAGTTAKQDAVAGSLAGAGGEIGDAVGGQPGRAVGSLVAPVGPGLVKTGAKELVRRTVRGGDKGRQAVAGVIDDFAESGATPNLGQATNNKSIQGAQTLSGKFLGGGPITQQLDDTTQKIQARLAAIADDLSPTTGQEAAGRTIQKGIAGKGGFIDRFKDKSGSLWTAVDSKIGDETIVSLQATRNAFGRLTNEGVFGKVLNNPQVAKLSSIAGGAGDQVPYAELKALRSQIGRRLSSNELISDIPRAELKQLYGAITQDIERVATSAGAAKQFSRANTFTRTGHKRIGDFVERITNKVDLDKIFEAVTKGGDGSQIINAFKRSLKPAEWDIVVSNVIRRLGRPPNNLNTVDDAGFSVSSFITQWNKLGPAKNALFSGSKKLNEYSRNLETITRTAQSFKNDISAASNVSETARAAANTTTAVGLGFSIATGNLPAFMSMLSVVAANNRAAALMANPSFVRWLAQSTKVSEAQLPAHIARLATIAAESGAEDILSFIESMSQE